MRWADGRRSLPSGQTAAIRAIMLGMQPAKATVQAVLDRLPDDCSLDEVLYHLYVVQKVEQGLADVASGNVVPHAVAMQELRRKWLTDREQ